MHLFKPAQMTSPTFAAPSTFIGAPVSESDRIILLDSLRGIALCGILLMNIPGFALPLYTNIGSINS